jgi:hypothetical protein
MGSRYPLCIWADQVLIREKNLYPSSVRSVLSHDGILIIGDSLSRRLTATLAMYLNVTVDEVVSVIDFGESKYLVEGGHTYKDWKDSIVPLAGEKIKLSFKWCPRLPTTQKYEEEILQLCPEFSSIVYFGSAFHQNYYNYIRSSLLYPVPSFKERYKNPIIRYFERICQKMNVNSQLILGISPSGDYSNIRKLRIRLKTLPSKSYDKRKRLNSGSALQSRLNNIYRFYEDFSECYKEVYQNIGSNPKCSHVSVKLLDHYSLFKNRTTGSMRDSGDSMYHLGNTARIQRMLDLLRNLY